MMILILEIKMHLYKEDSKTFVLILTAKEKKNAIKQKEDRENPENMQKLRQKFLDTAKSLIGIPYGKKYLEKHLTKDFIILGPTTANVFKMNNTYRFQILIKYQKPYNLLDVLKDLDNFIKTSKDIYIEIDINPLKV